MWLLLVKNNWKPLLIILALLVSHAWAYRHGMLAVEAEWAEAVSNQRANNLIRNERVSNALQTENANLRKRYDDLKRLRSSGSVRTGNPAIGCNAATCGNGLSGEVADSIGILMLQADLQTKQLIACQDWIRK